VKPLAVSIVLVLIALAAFSTRAAGQLFGADPPAAEAASPSVETTGLLQPEDVAGEGLPEPEGASEGSSPAAPIALPPVSPGGADRLTLAEAQSLAEASHPALREANALVRAARGNWVQVGLLPNPSVGYMGQEIGNEDTAGLQGWYIENEFITGGKLRLNRAVAIREVAVAEQRAEVLRLQVLTTVRVYYFEMLAAQRAVALANQLVDIANESVRVSEQRLKALDIPRVTLLQSQVERESTALLQVQAVERRDAAWRRLATVIGAGESTSVPLDGALAQPLPEMNWEVVRSRMLAESPELSQLRYDVDRARYAVQQASAGRVPNVMVQAGTQHDNMTDDHIANVQLSVPLPIFNRNQGAVAQACGELAAAQAALEGRALALEQRLASAMRDYATARERALKYATNVLPVARETLEIMNAGYQDGELDYLQVLSIQQTYAQQNVSYLQDLETAWKKWAEIDGLLVGMLPVESGE
jgi:cobalt-zinc-cadmium efflux system outer membrane protein